MSDIATKRCRVCGQVKPTDDFYPRADAPDGRRYDCRDCSRSRTHSYYENNRQKAAERKRKYQVSHRSKVFDHYGWSCACCGTTENLSIDHVNGNGAQHREGLPGRSRGRAGSSFYFWLVKQGFPAGYQTLCLRCNQSKGRGERCIFNHTERHMTLGSYLGHDAILKASALKTEEVRVPEWADPETGADVVLVRELRGRERDEWEASLAVQRGRQMVPDVANMRAKLVARTVIGEDGEPVFTQQDVAALGELSAAALDRVFEVASRLSGLEKGSVEEMAKNSAGTP